MPDWLRRMFARRPDEGRLVELERRAAEAQSQVTIARERADRILRDLARRERLRLEAEVRARR